MCECVLLTTGYSCHTPRILVFGHKLQTHIYVYGFYMRVVEHCLICQFDVNTLAYHRYLVICMRQLRLCVSYIRCSRGSRVWFGYVCAYVGDTHLY